MKEKENSLLWTNFERDISEVHSKIFDNVYNENIQFNNQTKITFFLRCLKICYDSIIKRKTKYVIFYGCLVRNLVISLMLYIFSASRQNIIILEFSFSKNERYSKRLLVNIVTKILYLIGVCSKYEVGRYSEEFSSDKFKYIPAPIENDYFLHNDIGKDQVSSYILSAGRGCRDYDTLIEAAFILDELNFIIISDRENIEHIENIPKNVIIFFDIERNKYYDFLKDSFAVVVPVKEVYKSAGHQVIYQAMAMGKAVIATRTNTTSEIIENYKNGVFFPEGDSQTLVKEIKNLVNDKEFKKRISQNASETSKNFDIETYFKFFKKAFYESLD